MYSYYTFTKVVNAAIFRYPAEGSYPQLDIPITVLTMSVPAATFSLSSRSGIAIVNTTSQQNNAVGVFLPAEEPQNLPRMTIGGFIETPCTGPNGAGMYTSSVTRDGNAVTYADIMVANMEGRGTADSSLRAIHPTFFRDDLGRQFDFPRVVDVKAEFVAGRPFRQNVTITFQLSRRAII